MGVARSGAEGWGIYSSSVSSAYTAGVRWMRASCGWSVTEPQPGVYDLSCLNSGIKTALNQNLSMVVVLFGSNKFYIDSGYAPYNSSHREAFVRYANVTVNHWKGKGIIWELWNEPDGEANFWKPKRNATDYMLLFKAVSLLFKENYPNEILGGASVSYFYMDFLESMFKNGLLEEADVFTIHPYRGSVPETLITSSRFEKSWPELIALMEKYTPAGKNIPRVQTEYGYSLTNGPAGGDPTIQAHLLARTYLINMKYGVSPILWYDWMDDCADPSKNDCTMGLIRYRTNGSDPIVKKPTFYAFETLSSLLSGYQFHDSLNSTNATVDFAITFKHSISGVISIAVWTSNAVFTHDAIIKYNAPSICFNAFDTFNESKGKICSDTNSTITVSLKPHSVAYLIHEGSTSTTSTISITSTTSSTTISTSSEDSSGNKFSAILSQTSVLIVFFALLYLLV